MVSVAIDNVMVNNVQKSSGPLSRRATITSEPTPTAVRKISVAKRDSVVDAPKVGPSSAGFNCFPVNVGFS